MKRLSINLTIQPNGNSVWSVDWTDWRGVEFHEEFEYFADVSRFVEGELL